MELVNCPSYEGYSINKDGEVFTHHKRLGLGMGKGGKFVIDQTFKLKLKSSIGHGGYFYVAMVTPKGARRVPVHTLLMDAFVGPRPKGLEVRHLDSNCTNNSLDNLAYGTRKENSDDKVKAKRHPFGEKHGRAKLTTDNVLAIRKKHNEGISIRELSKEYQKDFSTISTIVNYKHWKNVE